MNVVVEALPNCLASIRVEVGPEVVSKTREQIVAKITKEAKIPGFRAGKVPRSMVEKRFQKPAKMNRVSVGPGPVSTTHIFFCTSSPTLGSKNVTC